MIRCAASVAYIFAIAASVETRAPARRVPEVRGARDEQARGVELGRHVGERGADHLLIGERRAELPARA